MSVVFGLVVFSYKEFFLFNPLETSPTWLSILQLISVIGWISLLIVSPLLVLTSRGKSSYTRLIRASALLWPGSLLLIHIGLFITTNNAYLGYLLEKPIFIFTDILVPLTYVYAFKAAETH